jgi:hypothetical protein
MAANPNVYPELAEPHVDEMHGFTRLLELTPEQAAPYQELLTGLFDKYQGCKNDGFQRSWTDDEGPHQVTFIYDRETPDGSGHFKAKRDDLTGQITSHVIMYGPAETREDPSAWDETNFIMMGDGRIFLMHNYGFGIYVYKGDTPKDREMRHKPQPELKELLDRHIDHIETIERERNTPRARIARLGRKVVEAVTPDRTRLTPRRMKRML